MARNNRLLKLTSYVSALLVFSVLLISFGGCSKRYDNLPAFLAFPLPDPINNSVGRFKTSYLADQIHAYFRGNAGGPIAVATFVDLDNLYGTSTFGRLIAEQLMSELAMKGYNVVEVRQSDALQVLMEQGEFGLSREVGHLRGHQDVSALVVGTYTVSPVRVYLNARLVDPSSSIIMSAGTVEMAKTEEISRMLRNNAFPSSLERIPVRSLAYFNYPLPYYWPYGARRGKMFDDEESDMMVLPQQPPHGEGNKEMPKDTPQPKL